MTKRRSQSIAFSGLCLICVIPGTSLSADKTPTSRIGTWHTAASMVVTREYPGLAPLAGGRILAVTGHPLGGKSLASAEIYDVEHDAWMATGSLNVPRNGVEPGGLITLSGGRILITGGGSENRSVHECELYDPDTGKWTSTGSMGIPRCVHAATQLASGDVLVTGGIDWITEEVHNTAEIYSVQSGKWASTGSMKIPRFIHQAVRLLDGRVLVMGGISAYPDEVQASAEIYDPQTGLWHDTAPMTSSRRAHRAVLLGDGRVLVVGGGSGEKKPNRQLDSVELFDPDTEKWMSGAPLREARWGPTADVLRDGRVLVTGGGIGPPFGARRSAELFDPKDGSWSDAGELAQPRNGHRSIMLNDGRLLIVGGHFAGRYLASCEVYAP